MYLLFIPHQKSNGCCKSDRHLPSYPIRPSVMLYYLTSCSVTMPYSFWHLNPLKSSANHPTELLLTLSVLLLMSMQSSFFCVNVSLKMNMLGIEPQTPRFRVECASITPRVMFRDTQLSDQYWTSGAAVSADIVCWLTLLTCTDILMKLQFDMLTEHRPLFFFIGQWCWIGTLLKGTVITVLHLRLHYCLNFKRHDYFSTRIVCIFGLLWLGLLSSLQT